MILLIILISFLFIGFSTFLGYYIGNTYSKDHQDNKKNQTIGVIIGSSCSIGIVLLVFGLWWFQQTNIETIDIKSTNVKSRIFNPSEINTLEIIPDILFSK